MRCQESSSHESFMTIIVVIIGLILLFVYLKYASHGLSLGKATSGLVR
ncbi:MAG: hypothetical protein GXO42_02755 [bacterium]|nr:hypothetical protein [bacterium]